MKLKIEQWRITDRPETSRSGKILSAFSSAFLETSETGSALLVSLHGLSVTAFMGGLGLYALARRHRLRAHARKADENGNIFLWCEPKGDHDVDAQPRHLDGHK